MSDSRVSGFVPFPVAAGRGGGGGGFGGIAAPPIDFNLSSQAAALMPAYDAYLRRELTFSPSNEIFYLTSGGVTNFTGGSDDANLSAAFARNPKLRLFVAVNYYDLAAPFYAAEYTMAHLNVSPDVRAHNITVSHLEAGQMPYTDSKALAKLGKDLGSFVTQAASRQ